VWSRLKEIAESFRRDAAVDQVLPALPLVLVQERNGINERKIFFMVAAVARARGGEGERGRERIDHGQRRQEPLPGDAQHLHAARRGSQSD